MCFNGTSAASPAAAGMAALLFGQGLAVPGMPLAALVKHLAVDLGPPGPDNAYGVGADPTTGHAAAGRRRCTAAECLRRARSTRSSTRHSAGVVHRAAESDGAAPAVLDHRSPDLHVGGHSTERHVDRSQHHVDRGGQPVLRPGAADSGRCGRWLLDHERDDALARTARTSPWFRSVRARSPIFIPTGGNIIVDAMGYFTPSTATAAGRFVPINPRRSLDTRPTEHGPVPSGWTAHRPAAGESVRVEVPAGIGVPATGLSALVVNVTATDSIGAGFLQALPTGSAPGATSTVNYVASDTAATHAIVPLGADGTISVYTSNSSHIVVDVMGYITDGTAPASTTGLFVPIAPARYYDSRSTPTHARRRFDLGSAIGGSAIRGARRRCSDLDEPDVRSRVRSRVRHGLSIRRRVAAVVEPQLRRCDHGRQCRGGQTVDHRIPEYPRQHGYTCHHRCQRLLHGDLVSDQTDTKTGWLDNELLDNIRANVPLVYVDAVPVRVNEVGRVTDIGLLLRQAADGSISRMVVTGRVLYGERVRDALLRHLEKDLGPVALPRIPPEVAPFTVVEYFPDPDISGFHDPRHHAVSLAFVVPVAGDCQPTQEALDLGWYSPEEVISEQVRRDMTGGHDRLIRLALAHVGLLP